MGSGRKGEQTLFGSLGLHNDRRRSDVPDCKMMGYALSREFWERIYAGGCVCGNGLCPFTGKKPKLLTIYHYPNNSAPAELLKMRFSL